MTLSLKGERLKRYRDIAALFMKYGRGDLVSGAGVEDLVQDAKASAPGAAAKADDLAGDLADDNRIALLDLGMVARITPDTQESLLRLLLAVSEGRADEAATVAIAMGQIRQGFDEPGFRRDVADLVAQNQNARVAQIQVGRIVLMIARMSGERGIRVPPELTMLGKTLLNLDQIGRTLDPGFDPNAAIRRHAAELTRMRMRKSISPGRASRRWPTASPSA